MLRVILWILLGYFLYQFVAKFLIPAFRVTRQVRRQVKDFKQHMNQAHAQQQQQQFQQGAANTTQRPPSPSKEKAGDYIDFEELK